MMHNTKTRRLGSALAAGLVLLMAFPAHAQPLDAEVQATSLHCTVWLQSIQPGETASRVLHTECSEVPNTAVLSMLGVGSHEIIPIVPPLPLPISVDCEGDCADTVLGIDYEHSGYDGDSITWVGEARCDAGVSYGAPAMPAGWNDRVSSARAFAGCGMTHYEHEAYNPNGGATQGCTCESMDAMNDETSSVTLQ